MLDTKGEMYLLQEINVGNAIQAQAAKNQMLLLYATTLVERFKIFSTIYGEKCCLFFRHFPLKKAVKNSNLFHLF
jgi:hypothetical protein